MSAASTREWYRLWNGIMKSRASDSRAPFIDVRAAVSADRHPWGDATHFSDAGAEQAGKAVADGIIAQLTL
jgi:hypothetical protein